MYNMNYKKNIRKAFAAILGISMIFSSNVVFAEDAITETTETESYADEYKPIEFSISGFTVAINANTATLKWNIGAEKDTYITSHSVEVDVYRSVGDTSNYTRIASVNSNCLKTMSYVDSTLLAGNNYYYKLRISGYFDEVGSRVYHEVDGKFVEYLNNPVRLINPKTELSLSVNTLSNHRIRVFWYQIIAKGAKVTGYQVYRSSYN